MNVRMQTAISGLAAMAVVVLLTSGCGQKGPEMYEVSGTLTHNGKPIPEMEVVFVPDDTGTHRESMGVTDAEGKFVMMCSSTAGVAPGGHTVFVRDPAELHGEKTSDDADYVAVLAKYGNEKTSPMKITVEEDMADYELKLD